MIIDALIKSFDTLKFITNIKKITTKDYIKMLEDLSYIHFSS